VAHAIDDGARQGVEQQRLRSLFFGVGRARRCRWKDDSAFAKMAYVADHALHDLLDDMERLAKQRKPAISP
jgi:hypothetical protein